MFDRKKNKWYKNPHLKKISWLIRGFIFVSFAFIFLGIYNDWLSQKPFAVVLAFIFIGGVIFLRNFHDNYYLKYEKENGHKRFISGEEYTQLERQVKLERILGINKNTNKMVFRK